MSSVVDIDDYRPHMCIEGPGRVHVIPVAMIQNIIDGEMSVNDIEDPHLMRDILADWLQSIPETSYVDSPDPEAG